ncbi:DEAD/DEAH box helicase [Candidatus Uhrbacteria bacterium]|jgi:ATP-dependent RNA helicase RhlE|nr:DEAD/DEAH box helicase [Candidatus Uhrbacteria bacterium]MBT7716948.1 DEAD/DEAH box helicase [Candidatus Uhrbacteria bacterium]
MKQETSKRIVRFTDLGLSDDLLKALERLSFTEPTPIQAKAIPLALDGQDVIGIAQTGTGKTFAFALPMIQNIMASGGTGLIVVPTRELAFQVREEIDKAGRALRIKTALLIGGANIGQQIRSLRARPHIVVATPGRLIDHIERKTVKLDRVCMLVLDEADRMLDMGFAPQINQVLKSVPSDRQTMLFSATMAPEVAKIGHGYMKNPVKVEVIPTVTSASQIQQGVFYVEASKKFALLECILEEYKDGPVLVFCRTKRGTQKMARVLSKSGRRTEELHSNRSLNQRRYALANFKSGKSKTLVATDVAARGIDVKEIALVVNYDIPERDEDYIHRIGRTGRAGHTGCAVSFVQPEQRRDMKAIERLIGADIEVLEGPGTLTPEQVASLSYSKSRSNKKRGSGSRRQRPPSQSRQSGGSRSGGKSRPSGRSKNRQFMENSPEQYDPRRDRGNRKTSSSGRKPTRRSGGNATSRRRAENSDNQSGTSGRRSTGGYGRGQKSSNSTGQRRRSSRRSYS